MRSCFRMEAHSTFTSKNTWAVVLRVVVEVQGRERFGFNCVTRERIENTVLPVFGLGFNSFATKDSDHDAFTTGKIRGRLFVKMSLMTTATTMRKTVPDVLEKRCHIAFDFVTKLSSTAESSMVRPTYSQTKTSSQSASNASVSRKYCSRQISLRKSPAESTTLLS